MALTCHTNTTTPNEMPVLLSDFQADVKAEKRLAIVKISEIYTTNNPDEKIITYALGSCIAVTMYDPILKIGGMIHYQLPLSDISPDKKMTHPEMFADTGVTLLLKKMLSYGAYKRRIIVKAAGGSKMLDPNKQFNIGNRNYLILRKILWKNNMLIRAKDIGGIKTRNMSLDIATGDVEIKSGKEILLL